MLEKSVNFLYGARAMIEIVRLTGSGILSCLEDLANLRIKVFREFPYLYDGSIGYERDYLASYAECPESVVVLATDGDKIVGASTGLPLVVADPGFRKPFEGAGARMDEIFYFGESVLEKSARGQGIGHRFFDERENHAVALGFRVATFCSVVRPEDHPRKPAGYRTHDAFWSKRGYEKQPDLVAELAWREIGDRQDVMNRLAFWTKKL